MRGYAGSISRCLCLKISDISGHQNFIYQGEVKIILPIFFMSLSLWTLRALTLKACWTTCVNWSWSLRLMNGGLRLWRRNSSNMRVMRSKLRRPEGCSPHAWRGLSSRLTIEEMVHNANISFFFPLVHHLIAFSLFLHTIVFFRFCFLLTCGGLAFQITHFYLFFFKWFSLNLLKRTKIKKGHITSEG